MIITTLDSVPVNRNPSLPNELSRKNILMTIQIKIQISDLTNHKILISKYLLVMIHTIVLNIKKYKLQIQQLLKSPIPVDTYCPIGKSSVMLKMKIEKKVN